MDTFFKFFTNWSFETFTEATSLICLTKLKEEVKEVEKSLYKEEDTEKLAEEYADCLMCLFDSAARAGLSYQDINEAAWIKLEINVKRKWVKNPDGTYSHVK